jgi:hypothetical protein
LPTLSFATTLARQRVSTRRSLFAGGVEFKLDARSARYIVHKIQVVVHATSDPVGSLRILTPQLQRGGGSLGGHGFQL